MKKGLLYTLSFIGLLVLCACEPDDEDFANLNVRTYSSGETSPSGKRVIDPEPNNPYPLYVFPALDKTEPDFALHLASSNIFKNWAEYQNAPAYSSRAVVAAIYATDCKDCYAQAPFFVQLAKDFANTDAEFAVLFTENDPEEINTWDWIKNFKKNIQDNGVTNLGIYYSSEDFCKKGLCKSSPNVMVDFISGDKVQKSLIGFPLDPNGPITPQQAAFNYEQATRSLLGME